MISDSLIFNQTRFCRKIELYSVYWRTACFYQIFQFVFTSSCVYEGSCLIYVICVCLFVCLRIVVSNTHCVFALFFFVLCILCFQFLWIVHFWVFDCPFCILLTFICLILRIFGCFDRQKKIVFNFTPTFKNDYFIIIFLLVQSFSF